MNKNILPFACALLLSACSYSPDETVTLLPASSFQHSANGEDIQLYTLSNKNGMTAQFTNYGARLVSLWVPSRDRDFKDVVWGYESLKDYKNATDVYSGPIVGRFGNRIGKGEFTLDGKKFNLTRNDKANHHHGGAGGFWNRVWKARPGKNTLGEETLELTYLSPDKEEGYPGNLEIKVTYTLTGDNALKIDYLATTDQATILNPTNHSYFNLHGTSARSATSHLLKINGDRFTETDSQLIATGKLTHVAGTALDFRKATRIGKRINAGDTALKYGRGYDQNWVLNKPAHDPKAITEAAELYEPETGINLTVYTDQPGIQFYSGNFMDGKDIGKRGDKHNYRSGVALETQNFPDAPNHANFPSAVLRPGETYTQTAIYKFGVK